MSLSKNHNIINNDTQIPLPIKLFVDFTNTGDSKAFIDLFTEDAYLEDWGRTYLGREGATSWNQTDNIGQNSHFEIKSFKTKTQPNNYVLTVKVSGNGYNGTGDIAFTLKGNQIARMLIS